MILEPLVKRPTTGLFLSVIWVPKAFFNRQKLHAEELILQGHEGCDVFHLRQAGKVLVGNNRLASPIHITMRPSTGLHSETPQSQCLSFPNPGNITDAPPAYLTESWIENSHQTPFDIDSTPQPARRVFELLPGKTKPVQAKLMYGTQAVTPLLRSQSLITMLNSLKGKQSKPTAKDSGSLNQRQAKNNDKYALTSLP